MKAIHLHGKRSVQVNFATVKLQNCDNVSDSRSLSYADVDVLMPFDYIVGRHWRCLTL